MNRFIPIVPIVLALALTAAACHKNSSTTTTAPTPSPTQTTETFNGTVAVRGSASNNFTVANTGRVDVTLTAASPPATVVMGLGVGTAGGAGCTVLPGASTNTPAGATVQLSGTVSAGALCVKISDVGNQTAPVTYTVTVAHF
jgi:hypothetical protein